MMNINITCSEAECLDLEPFVSAPIQVRWLSTDFPASSAGELQQNATAFQDCSDDCSDDGLMDLLIE